MQAFIVLICFVVVLGMLSIVSILIGPDERMTIDPWTTWRG